MYVYVLMLYAFVLEPFKSVAYMPLFCQRVLRISLPYRSVLYMPLKSVVFCICLYALLKCVKRVNDSKIKTAITTFIHIIIIASNFNLVIVIRLCIQNFFFLILFSHLILNSFYLK